ncbi:uncharacterized protein PF11_0213-like isoform X2 [Pseudomyrmex gracilis]|uniref:uncharacterized protein PF11_0213-like isoform X2 n=1 Tax=Pseudomyrmex gracilis TaxID=219809 RepID=UPI000995DACF|nr:uncharacterized protein PF11_0213-like isoform X2 [Pseudomyrmex gracilis]
MKYRRKSEQENKNKLNVLNLLHPCKVVLDDIVLNTELLSIYEQNLLKNAETKLKQVSSSYMSNSFNNVHPDIKSRNKKVKKSIQKENVLINKRSSCKRRKEEYENECSKEIVKHDTYNISTDINYIGNKVLAIREKPDNVIRPSENRKNRVSSSEKIVNVHNVPIDTSYNNTNEIIAITSEEDTVSNTFEKERDTTTVDEETVDNYIWNYTSIDETNYSNENTLSGADKKYDSNVSLYREKSTVSLDEEDTDQTYDDSIDANCDNANTMIMTKKHNNSISLSQEQWSKASFDETREHHAINTINVNTSSTDTNDMDKKTSLSAGFAKKLSMTSNIRINNKLSSIDIVKATKCVVKLQRSDVNLYTRNVSANLSDIDSGKTSSSVNTSVTDVKTDMRTNLNNEYTSSVEYNTFKTSETSPKINYFDNIIPSSPEICRRKSNKKKVSVIEHTTSLFTENKILSKQNMQTVQLKRKRYMIEDDYCEQDSMEKNNYDDNVKEFSPINESAMKAANVIKEKEHEKIKSHILNTTNLALEINNNFTFRSSTINKNTSDFTDIDKTQEVDRSLSVNKEKPITQTEYPGLEDNFKDSKSKRIKLNRNTPLDTDNIDLRKILEEKRKLRQLQNLENKSNVTYKYNEKNISVSEQIRADNTCNISINNLEINDKYDVSNTHSESEINSSFNDEPNIGFVHENRDICDNVKTQKQDENNVNKKTFNDSDADNNYKNNYIDDDNDNDDDDCISLYANETFDESQDDSVREENKTNKSVINKPVYSNKDDSVREENKTNKSVINKPVHFNKNDLVREENKTNKSVINKPVHSNEKDSVREEHKTKKSVINKSVYSNEYVMSDNSIDNFLRHNTQEFNKEYANNVIDSIEKLNGLNKTEKISTIQQQQASYTNKTKSLLPNEAKVFHGYCYMFLRKNVCYIQNKCRYSHDDRRLIMTIEQKPSKSVAEIIRYAIQNFTQFSKECYFRFLQRLTVEQILTFFHMFYDNNFTFGPEYIEKIILELFRHRKMSLKLIVNCIVTYIPIKRLNELYKILEVVKQLVRPSEYWDTLRTIYFALMPINADKFIIYQLLFNCIKHRQLVRSDSVNDIDKFLNTLDPTFVSQLDENTLREFRSLLAEKNGTNSSPTTCVAQTSAQYFGKSGNNVQTIASPDPSTDVHADILESDIPFCDATPTNNADTTGMKKSETNDRDKSYALQPIETYCRLPEPRSVFRYHEHCWKFYLDLDRLKMGFYQKDYDYIIDILKLYVDKQVTDKIFYHTCEILRNEIRRSFKNHVKTLLQRAVQRDVFGDLGTLIFDLGLTVVASLIDEEAWELAHQVIHSLSTYDFPFNAAFYLLLAEIYLANKNPLEALNLLKTHNILSTSRSRWYVKSIVNDEDIRNKIIYILLDLLLCNEYIEHAFFLFRFLIVDQSSQYYPIDLSRYVDKLIILSLSKKDTILLREISILTLKYTFALHATTCRALLSTVINNDEALGRQIYNYAKNIGVYSRLQFWPITSIILNTDLTEEEIYIIILQLLKDLLLDLGHAAEFAKFSQVKVFLILEIKSSNFHYARHYHNIIYTNAKSLIKNVLTKRFEPPLLLQSCRDRRICRIQSKSLIDHLKAMYCS